MAPTVSTTNSPSFDQCPIEYPYHLGSGDCGFFAADVGGQRTSMDPDLSIHALVLEELKHSVGRLDKLHPA